MVDQNELLPPPGTVAKQSSRGIYLAVIAMLIVWVAVLTFRNQIWAEWYAYKLTHTADPAERMDSFQRLVSLENHSYGVGVRLTENEDAGARSMGIALIAMNVKPDTLDRLKTIGVNDPDVDIRRSAIRAIAGLEDERVLPDLEVIILEEAPEDAKMEAMVQRVTLGRDSSLPVLQKCIEQADGLVRIQAIQAIGFMRVPKSTEMLVFLLDDHSSAVGTTAFDRIGEMMLADPKEDATQKRTYTVSREAARSLRRLTGENFGYPEEEDTRARDAAIEAWKQWLKNQDNEVQE